MNSLIRKLTVRTTRQPRTEVLPRSEAAEKLIASSNLKHQKHNIKLRYNFNDVVKQLEKHYKTERTKDELDIDNWIEDQLVKHKQKQDKEYIDKIMKGASLAKKLNSSQKTLVKSDSQKTLVKKNSNSRRSDSKKTTKRKYNSSSSKKSKSSSFPKTTKRSRMLIL